jgi:nucleoside-diphosphate-sugar epimerase
MPGVFVTGARGFVGRRVVEALVRHGHRVVGLTRSTTNDSRDPRDPRIDWVHGCLTDAGSYGAVLGEVEHVIHLAAVLSARRASDYECGNVVGTRTLLDACVPHGERLRRVVVVSSIAAMGPKHDGTPLREADPCHPLSVYGRSKLASERAARAYGERLPITVIRPAFVYGRGDTRAADHLRTLLLSLDRPWKTPIVELSFVHVRDLAELCVRATAVDVPSGETYLVADPASCTWDDVRTAVVRALETLAAGGRIAAGVAEHVLTRARALDVVVRCGSRFEYWGCDTTRAREALGFRGTRSLQAGALEAIGAYAEDGFFAAERWPGHPTTVV